MEFYAFQYVALSEYIYNMEIIILKIGDGKIMSSKNTSEIFPQSKFYENPSYRIYYVLRIFTS